jgi:hypothetical protein
MAKFMIGYLGNPPKPSTPEEGAAHMGKWKEWIAGLGDAVTSSPSPVKSSKILNAGGVSDDNRADGLTGYIMIEASDMAAALEMAKGDPYLDMTGGTLQVAEIMSMG